MHTIVTTDNAKEWKDIVEAMPAKDVFYTAEYMKLFEKYFDQQAFLFDFKNGSNRILHTFFKRKIDTGIFSSEETAVRGRDMYDLVSPWYFGGLLMNGSGCERSLPDFFSAFREYCIQNNIVSEFMRLNPMFTQESYLGGFVDLKKFNDIVYIDLSQDEDVIWRNMKDSNREKIRKARRNKVVISNTRNDSDVEEFHRLYLDSMKRKNAGSYYFFSLDFLKDIFSFFPEDSTLLLARYQGKLIGGIMMLGKYDCAYSYLSTSDPDFLNLGANNILKYEGTNWAKKRGYRYFVLGGGNAVNDSLFKFKASFSNTYRSFFIGTIVYNKELYDLLTGLKIRHEEKTGKYVSSKRDFFPRYRLEV